MPESNCQPVHFDPGSPAFAADPYPHYRQLRENAPVFPSREFGMIFLSRYKDIFTALTDKRLGRAEPPELAAPQITSMPDYDRYVRINLLETEGATHTRLRRLLSRALSPKRVANLGERVQQVARGLIDRQMPDTDVDFIREIAEPLPVTIIAELLGWPDDERHRLRPWSADIVRLYEAGSNADDAMRAEKACHDFAAMLDALATERKERPREDFISALAALENEPGGLARDELISSCMLLLNAGHEATVNAAGNGLLALLRHPEALRTLAAEPSLIDSAIEEMLRYDAPLHLFHRFAYEELTIGGVLVPKGSKIGLLYGAANRDPDVFPQPDLFDVSRQPNRHLSFGAATHFCFGAPLARLELRTLFATLIAKTKDLTLSGDEPRYRPGLVFRGPESLTVRWGRTSASC